MLVGDLPVAVVTHEHQRAPGPHRDVVTLRVELVVEDEGRDRGRAEDVDAQVLDLVPEVVDLRDRVLAGPGLGRLLPLERFEVVELRELRSVEVMTREQFGVACASRVENLV